MALPYAGYRQRMALPYGGLSAAHGAALPIKWLRSGGELCSPPQAKACATKPCKKAVDVAFRKCLVFRCLAFNGIRATC
jgi:hypothetical protein